MIIPFFLPAIFTMLFLGIFYFTACAMGGIYIVWELGAENHMSVYGLVCFGLGNALAIPVSKHLTDRFGPFRVTILSLIAYAFSSSLCGFAPNYFFFCLYQIALGVSSGFFFYLWKTMLDLYVTDEQKNRYRTLGVFCFALVPPLGACFGATLAYESFWRWIYHVNLPIALFLAFYFWRISKDLTSPKKKDAPFDGVGFIFYSIAVISLILATTVAQQIDWQRSDLFVICLSLGLPSLLFFILWDLKHPNPLIDLKLFRNKGLAYTCGNLAIMFSSYFGMIILIPLWLQIYANYTPLWIAAIIIAMAIFGLVGAILNQFWLQKFDPRFTLAVGIISCAISCIYSTYFDIEIDLGRLVIARSLAGLGLVLFLLPLFRMLFMYAPKEKGPESFVLFQTIRVISSSLGAGAYVVLWQRRQVFFHERLGEALTPNAPLTQDFFRRATQIFYLTEEQATSQLDVFLETQATSLALNDVFGFMAIVLEILFFVLLLSFLFPQLAAVSITEGSNR